MVLTSTSRILFPLNLNNQNPTVSNTNFEDYIKRLFSNNLLFAILFLITSLLGTPGNLLAIWITGFKLKNTNAVWILHLAIADLMCCVFLSFMCASCFIDYYYSSHLDYLHLIGFIAVFLSVFASITFLTAMSIDRCASVMYPLWYKTHRTSKQVHITAAIIWVIILVLIGFYFYFYFIDRFFLKSPNECLLIMVLTLCFIIIIACYSLICFKLKKVIRQNRSQRSYRVITALVICFFICWSPYYIYQIINHHLAYDIDNILFNLSFSLACFNSCINPIIYVFIGQDFRETLMASLPPGVKTVINKCCNQTPRYPDTEEIPNTDV